MNSGAFNTELPTMEVAAAHVVEVNERVQVTLRDLLDRLEPLVTTWQGAAASSFHALKERWHQSARELNDALLAIGEGLSQAEITYAAADDTNHAGFAGLTSHLGPS